MQDRVGGTNAVYVAVGKAIGWMTDPRTGDLTLLNVHDADAQQSDRKTGTAADVPEGHGPHGDVTAAKTICAASPADATFPSVPTDPDPETSRPGTLFLGASGS